MNFEELARAIEHSIEQQINNVDAELQEQLDHIPGFMQPIILEVVTSEGVKIIAATHWHLQDKLVQAERMPNRVVSYGKIVDGISVIGLAHVYRLVIL